MPASGGVTAASRTAAGQAGDAGGSRGLHTLDLSGNPLGPAGAETLAAWPGLAAVRRLRLGGCGVGAEGLRALARSPHAAGLVSLDLRGNDIDRPGTGLGSLSGLRELSLGGNPLGNSVGRLLTAERDFAPWRVALGRSDITEETRKRLEAWAGPGVIEI